MKKDDPKFQNLSPQDKKLWRRYVEQEGIEGAIKGDDVEDIDFAQLLNNFEGNDDATVLQETKESEKKIKCKVSDPSMADKKREKSEQDWAQLDRATLTKLKKGKLNIEARIDLHGMSRGQAYPALEKFIFECHAKKKKCVLVITGKGKPRLSTNKIFDTEDGVLKRHVPIWLSEGQFKNIVLRFVEAKPKDGGSGALYLYLRR